MISNLQADGIAPRCSPEFADRCPCCCYVCCKEVMMMRFWHRLLYSGLRGGACSRR